MTSYPQDCPSSSYIIFTRYLCTSTSDEASCKLIKRNRSWNIFLKQQMFHYSLIIAKSLTFLRVSLLAKPCRKSTVFCSAHFHAVINFVLNFVIKHFSEIKAFIWLVHNTHVIQVKFFSLFPPEVSPFWENCQPFPWFSSALVGRYHVLSTLSSEQCYSTRVKSFLSYLNLLRLQYRLNTKCPPVIQSLNGTLIHLFTIHSSNG